MSGLPIIPTSDSRRQSKTARREDSFRVRDHPGVITRWLEENAGLPPLLPEAKSSLQRPVCGQLTFGTCHNGGERIPTMAVCSGKFEWTEKRMRSPRSLKALAFGIALSYFSGITRLSAQSSPAGIEHTDNLRGTVVNSATHEPISRALVFSPDNRFATMTDNRGHFEFTFPRGEGEMAAGFAGSSNVHSLEPPTLHPPGITPPTLPTAPKTRF